MAGRYPGVHADRRARRRLAEDRGARGASRACAAIVQAVPRGATASPAASSSAPPAGREARGRPRRRPRLLQADLGRGARAASSRRGARRSSTASRALRGEARPRPAHRRRHSAIRIDDEREHQRASKDWCERFMPALAPRVKLYTKALPDLRGVRRPGRDRQGAAQQGLAEVRRLHRHQPDRGAGRDRRQHRPVRRQAQRPPRGHHRQDQPRGGEGDRAADPAARPRRHHRPRLHRHGGAQEPPEGDAGARPGAAARPLAVEGASQVSDFGLIIITRKRVKQSLERVMTQPCPYCSGSGRHPSRRPTICYEILDEVRKVAAEVDGPGVQVRVNPDIARALREEESAVLREMQAAVGEAACRSGPTRTCTTSSST
ncbi:MAG: hypothetical protein MZU95_13550 [Desulfomicrobium escambiense]|nr:hypothetical protein [Desulfomicrobium escambiense]